MSTRAKVALLGTILSGATAATILFITQSRRSESREAFQVRMCQMILLAVQGCVQNDLDSRGAPEINAGPTGATRAGANALV